MFCGIDWAEDHHDVALVDHDGTLIAKRRISDDAGGYALLLQLLADAGDDADAPIPVAIETSRGLLVACLRATGRQVFAINPMAVSRYRDRHSVAGKKSDAGDALVLAHILRTDMHAHRALPADSDQARAVTVLARAQQDAVWDRVIAHNRLRSLLHEYYPALLVAFASKRGGLMRPEARTLLAAAPTPSKAARLTHTQLVAILRRAGRTRLLQAEAARLQQVLRADYLHQPVTVEDAMGVHALALLSLLDTACTNAERLAEAAATAFRAHPTPRSSPASPARASSPEHASSASSATTPRASPTPAASRPTQVRHRSPGPAAGSAASPPGASRTSASPPPATSGPSPPSPHHPEPEPTTTADAATATATSPLNATCSTDSSAAYTTAWPPAPGTTRPSPSLPRRPNPRLPPLDR